MTQLAVDVESTVSSFTNDLRKLREEIGMTSHGAVRETALPEVLAVEDVRYAARKWSWEVEAISEAPLDDLPSDLSPLATRWIGAVRNQL